MCIYYVFPRVSQARIVPYPYFPVHLLARCSDRITQDSLGWVCGGEGWIPGKKIRVLLRRTLEWNLDRPQMVSITRESTRFNLI